MMKGGSDHFSVAEAAHRLNVSVDTVRRRIKSGEIAGYRDQKGQWWLDLSSTPNGTVNFSSAPIRTVGDHMAQSGPPISLGHASTETFTTPEENLIALLSDEVSFLRRRLEVAEEELKKERESSRLERQSMMALLDVSGRNKS